MRALLARHPVSAFFLLTLAISWGGLWAVAGRGGIPGGAADVERGFAIALLLLLVGPAAAAVVVLGATGGRAALRSLARRMAAWRVAPRWLALAAIGTPLAVAASLGILSRFWPAYRPAILVTDEPWVLFLAGLAAGLAGGLLEEIGWTGFAVTRLRRRHGRLATGLLVGVVWAVWHLPITLWASGDAEGSLSWALLAPPLLFYLAVLPPYRVLMVWLHDRSGSLPAVVLMHASLTASTLFVLAPQEAALVPSYLLWAGVAWVAVAWAGSSAPALGEERG